MALESWNSSWRPKLKGGTMIIKPETQQLRIKKVQTIVHDGHVMWEFTDGHIVVIVHQYIVHRLPAEKILLLKQNNKNIWLVQALQVMILSPADILYRNLGIQTVVNETSKKEKFLRKKYIGVLRWESTSVRVIIIKFPVTLKEASEKQKDEKQDLQFWVICQSQKDESCYCSVVFNH